MTPERTRDGGFTGWTRRNALRSALVAAGLGLTPSGVGTVSASARLPTRPPSSPGGGFERDAKLVPENGDAGDLFGLAVALSADGTRALVGAPNEAEPNGEAAGAAYVFARHERAWRRETKLAPEDGDTEDFFGESTALAEGGDVALVGAGDDEDPAGVESTGRGAAYVFRRGEEGWTQRATLAAPGPGAPDEFGQAVALSNEGTALVGAVDEAPSDPYGGSAYVFRRDGDWRREAELDGSEGSPDHLGWSVALSEDGRTALVGAFDGGDADDPPGIANLYRRVDGDWSHAARLAAPDGDPSDRFGQSVALSADGTRALVGAPNDENEKGQRTGTGYVFRQADDVWRRETTLVPETRAESDRFGQSVALADGGRLALLAAGGDDDPDGERTGSVYVFRRRRGTWRRTATVAASDGDAMDNFGGSIAPSSDGRRVLVGASDDEDPNGPESGSAYVFDALGPSATGGDGLSIPTSGLLAGLAALIGGGGLLRRSAAGDDEDGGTDPSTDT